MKIISSLGSRTLDQLLIAVTLLTTPLLLRLMATRVTTTEENLYKNAVDGDIFSHFRGQFIIIISVIALFYLVASVFTDKLRLKSKPLALFSCIYAVTVALSYLFTRYPAVAQRGAYDRYEGVWVLMAYLILFLTAFVAARKMFSLNFFAVPMYVSSCIVAFIGILQPFGINIINSPILKPLIVGAKYLKQVGDPFKNSNHAFSTLGNSNFVGSYMAVVLPFAYCAMVRSDDKRIRALATITFVLCSIFLFASGSLAGLIGVTLGFGAAHIMLRQRDSLVRAIAPLAAFILCGALSTFLYAGREFDTSTWLLLCAIIAIVCGYEIYRRFLTTQPVRIAAGSILLIVVAAGVWHFVPTGTVNQGLYMNSVTTSGNTLTLDYLKNGEPMLVTITNQNGKLQFTGNGTPLDTTQDRDVITFTNTAFEDLKLTLTKYPDRKYSTIFFQKLQFGFFVTADAFHLVNTGYIGVPLEYPKSIPVKGFEKLGSGRGYIWSVSIPMMMDSFFIGRGADTYALVFPQNDIAGKFNMGTAMIVVDKPHNWYMQAAIHSGMIHLAGILGLLIYALQLGFKKLQIEMDYAPNGYVVAGIAMIIAYHATSFFNDSYVSTAPIFWMMYGASIGFGYMQLPENTLFKKSVAVDK